MEVPRSFSFHYLPTVWD